MNYRTAALCIALVSALPRAAAAQQQWNDARTLDLVRRATERRALQLADTGLVDYRATAHGYLTFLAQFGEGFTEPPKIVKADELALEIYWHSPDLSKQRIIGRRDTLLLPTDINYHRDHLGILQNNFPGIIRLGDGDEVRDVPHPLSAPGLGEYDFAISDSLEIRLGATTLHVYEVRLRPRNDGLPRAVGAIYLDRETAEVVRMTLGFTRAALKDKDLDDVTVVLENGLIEGRFWLPRRQEIEIRRTASWMNYPARGIIRGRWEICCYEVNAGVPLAYFHGPEIVQAPPAELRAHKFEGGLLDSLPPDVRAVTDEDVRRVREDARALVRAQSLARARTLALSATGVSDFARFDRVEGLALGAGLDKGLGAGFSLGASGRYGFSDRAFKGRATMTTSAGNGASGSLFAERDYRDVADEPETSGVRNSLAAQEFGSDYTDTYDLRGAGLSARFPAGRWWMGFSGEYERHSPLSVHARPAAGRFEPAIPAERLRERRAAIEATRPTSLSVAGFEAAERFSLTGVSYTRDGAAGSGELLRPSLSLDFEKPVGRSRLVLHTFAAAALGGDSVPAQHLVFLGGPATGPGYDFHEFAGRAGASQRIEWRVHAPFPSIPLGRYGRAPAEITLAPYFNAVWTDRPAAFRAPRQGWYPSVGLGAITLFDVLRIDVARGLRNGRWTFSVDAGRDFWSVL